ncbi:hypothetical protein [Amycolatopsis regifaucium]|uniref:WXG100 family type VII secretion target n=1 Tax=Amycolatopsis regifaucium TaxID=546365 RepID=A0A154MCX5_9PSEU|nr:hypothetical protein [Amycolatopsis regifaucium]KZB82093.1 hypothetical protein AVL48_09095 [Amycolatopsis regifaucium]OKA05835.1 hypothetical protein ATP06_0221895 [Amycolatopsis regifaucium]SFG82350.1 hypothetical protein SAMN04489731_101600 [Amycolatopsis regifaucium]
MTAQEEDDLPTRAEVEQIINDERIPWDVRRDLALQYLDYIEDEDPDEVGFASDEDKNGFRDAVKAQMKISEGDLNGNNLWGGMLSDTQLINSLEDSVQVAYGNAKGYVDKFAEEGRQANQKANADARAGLDQMASKATATNPAAETSDQILDFGKPSFRNIEIFVPLYNRSVAAVRSGAPADINQLRELYDQQRKIPFGKFAAGADEFTKLKEAVVTSSGDVSGEMKKNLGGWEGAAADQARTYQQNYEAKTKVVADGAEHAAVAMMTAAASVAKFCRDKADWMVKASCDRLGEVTAQDLDRIIRIAELGNNASQDDFKHCSKFLDQQSRDMINDDDCDLDDETIDHIIKQVQAYLSGTFNPFYSQYLNDFRTMCANTHTAVAGAWQGLTDFFSQLEENPFVNLDAAAGTSDGGFKTEGGQDSGGGRTGGPGPGPGSGGGGDTTPIGDTKPPAPPSPPDPNINPVTDKPLEVDPETGEAYPIDPRTGEAVKPDGPETVTVEQGDHKISMAEPGKDGKMDISVDDGTGHPKDYKLDFGDSRPLPDDTPNRGPGGDAAAGGAIHRDTAQRPDAPRADDQAFKPGPDGKIHIEDGGLKITAERPDGADGPTRVTVDDGSGKPTTYTLGEEGPAARTAAGAGGGAPDVRPDAAVPGGRHAAEHVPGQPVEAAAREHATAQSAPAPVSQGGDQGVRTHEVPVSGAVEVPAAATEQTTSAAASDSTSPQSWSNPLSDDGLDEASDPAGTGGGVPTSSTSGLGSAPGGGGDQSAAMGGGMGMLGGGMMGGAGAGGSGEDQQRTSSGYRVDGGLFDTATSTSRISGSLDDDGVIGFR